MNPIIPTLEEFLAADIEQVQKIAPQTLLLAAGGTRRAAKLAGIDTSSDYYPEWSRQQMVNCLDILFQHGIQHIFTPVLTHTNYHEVGHYRQRLLDWINWGLAGEAALADYARHGWRVRLFDANDVPDLIPVADKLVENTAGQGQPTVWFCVAPTSEAPWDRLFRAVHRTGAQTRAEAIAALYGEAIPPAELYLGFGKPEVYADLVPPLLIGKMQCYWRQRLGYGMDGAYLRKVLYDFAFLRKTYRKDKTGRDEAILEQAAIWNNPVTVGLGQKLGPFWYPE